MVGPGGLALFSQYCLSFQRLQVVVELVQVVEEVLEVVVVLVVAASEVVLKSKKRLFVCRSSP